MDIPVVASAFGAGLLSFFSPCVLPLLPVYAGILTTDAGDGAEFSLARRCANTVAFVLGISCVFVTMGAGVASLGSFMKSPWVTMALGVVVVFFGLLLSGVVTVPFLQKDSRAGALGRIKVRGVLSAFLLGVAFSFGWTPCVGPILGSILAVAAGQGPALQGGALLLCYSLGLCVPFVAITLASGAVFERLRGLSRFLPVAQRIGGGLIAIMGVWMIATQVGTVQAQSRAAQAASEDAQSAALVSEAQGVHAGDAETSGISTAWKNVSLTDLDGNVHRLSEYKGEPLYFEFWGSWCSSCVADLGQLEEVYQEHAEAGDVRVTSVVVPDQNGERSPEDFVAWAREKGVKVPVLMDTNGSLSRYIGVNGFPTSVFVGSDGQIAKVRVGAIERDELESLLAELS